MRSTDVDYLAWLTTYSPIAGAETPEGGQATATEGEAGGEGGTETPAPQGLDPALIDRAQEAVGRLESFAERFEGQPGAQEGQAPEDELGGLYGQPQQPQYGEQGFQGQQPGYDPLGGLDPNDPQVAQAILQDAAQRAAQEAITPYIEQQRSQALEREGDQLLEDYPELTERENAQALGQDSQQWASDIVTSQFGQQPQLVQALGQNPAFLELVHLAAKGAEHGEQETPAGGSDQAEVPLEGGGAANAGAAGQQTPLGQTLKESLPRRGFFS